MLFDLNAVKGSIAYLMIDGALVVARNVALVDEIRDFETEFNLH